VDRDIVEAIRTSRRRVKILALGCAWLDEQARDLGAGEFALLAVPQREAIVATAEQSVARSLPRVFFSTTLQLAFERYYAHPETWGALGYDGPPQPGGFPGFAGPPAEADA
jgi:hypothetical protein